MSTEQSSPLASKPAASVPLASQPAASQVPAGQLPAELSDAAAASPGASRLAEESGELVAMSFPGARRVAGWLFWVIFPLLCVGAIYTSVNNVAHHIGKKPAGIRGSFVVQPRSCSQGFCSFGGLFTSDDHTIRNLPLLGDPRWHTDEVHKVTYDPKSVEVNALPGHWDPTASVVATLGALTYLIVLGQLARSERRLPWRQSEPREA
jgi:hypothetical protein